MYLRIYSALINVIKSHLYIRLLFCRNLSIHPSLHTFSVSVYSIHGYVGVSVVVTLLRSTPIGTRHVPKPWYGCGRLLLMGVISRYFLKLRQYLFELGCVRLWNKTEQNKSSFNWIILDQSLTWRRVYVSKYRMCLFVTWFWWSDW